MIRSVLLAALAFAGQARPRLMRDWPEMVDANFVARTRKIVTRRLNACLCRSRAVIATFVAGIPPLFDRCSKVAVAEPHRSAP
jgi:hypothetical protein